MLHELRGARTVGFSCDDYIIFFIPKVVSSLCWFIIIVNLREMLSSLKLSSKTVIAK